MNTVTQDIDIDIFHNKTFQDFILYNKDINFAIENEILEGFVMKGGRRNVKYGGGNSFEDFKAKVMNWIIKIKNNNNKVNPMRKNELQQFIINLANMKTKAPIAHMIVFRSLEVSELYMAVTGKPAPKYTTEDVKQCLIDLIVFIQKEYSEYRKEDYNNRYIGYSGNHYSFRLDIIPKMATENVDNKRTHSVSINREWSNIKCSLGNDDDEKKNIEINIKNGWNYKSGLQKEQDDPELDGFRNDELENSCSYFKQFLGKAYIVKCEDVSPVPPVPNLTNELASKLETFVNKFSEDKILQKIIIAKKEAIEFFEEKMNPPYQRRVVNGAGLKDKKFTKTSRIHINKAGAKYIIYTKNGSEYIRRKSKTNGKFYYQKLKNV